MTGGLHTSGYLLVWTVHYLTLNQDIYHNLVEEMKERVGSDQKAKLKDYAYDPNTYVPLCKYIVLILSETTATLEIFDCMSISPTFPCLKLVQTAIKI